MSALPSAIRPNFTAEPTVFLTALGRPSMNASLLRSPWERLTAAIQGSPCVGSVRVRTGSAAPMFTPSNLTRSAPRPTMPRQSRPSAGAATMPSSGTPSVTRARLTVNSSRPATNSLVPSSGSIRKKLSRNGGEASWVRSSDSVGTSPASCARPSAMMRSAARSASVTGEPSCLPSTRIAARLTARIASPACLIHRQFHPTRLIRCGFRAASSRSQASCHGLANVRTCGIRQACVIRRVRAVQFQEPFMSDASSPGTATAPDALELAALLCSRVCHDLISPVGAIVNGLEVLDDDPKPDDREFALDLIRKSAKTASARLQFCRLAFGAAGSAGAQIDLGDAQAMARGHIEDGKITISWNLPRVLLAKNRVKLLLNMLVIAQQTIPRGGTLTVDPVGDGETMSFRVIAAGLNARLPQNIAGLLSAGSPATIDAHAVQPYYTRLLAQACGLTVTLAPDGDRVVVSAA